MSDPPALKPARPVLQSLSFFARKPCVDTCACLLSPGTNDFSSAAKEGRRISREAAARISALRDQDYEGYLRLAQSAKDARLRTLLDKTAEIISDLGLKVCTF